MLVMESGGVNVKQYYGRCIEWGQMKKGLKGMMEWIMRYMGKEGDLADN